MSDKDQLRGRESGRQTTEDESNIAKRVSTSTNALPSDGSVGYRSLMSVSEVAGILGYDRNTIQQKVKELFPDKVQNGVKTLLNIDHVTTIKANLVPRNLLAKSQVENAVTDLEMMERMRSVMEWSSDKIRILQIEKEEQAKQIEHMKPLAESAEALTRCDQNMCITEAAKHFGLHPKLQVFPYLRARGYLTSRDLPTQDALDTGILAVRQNQTTNGDFRSQAVVEKASLEMWRTNIVPRIIAWSNLQIPEVTQ